MADEFLSQGNDAFVDENYDDALKFYSEAIENDDINAAAYVKRATVFNKLNRYDEAVVDTKSALGIDTKNKLAFFRQGQAYVALKDFKKGKVALRQALALGETHTLCSGLLQECHTTLGTTEEEDQKQIAIEEAEVAAKPKPETPPTPVESTQPNLKENRIAHDWYQTAEFVTVSIMIKNVDPKNVGVDFTDTNMSCNIKLHTGADYSLDLDLCHQINTASSKFTVRKTKIEIKMKKNSAIQWKDLEGDGTSSDEVAVRMAGSVVDEKPPGYDQGKKWDKLANDITQEEKDTKLEGDAALNSLFKNIYGDADEDTRRAMNKSFVESGGTVLSTNWKDIGKEKTDIKPPSGMEHKKW